MENSSAECRQGLSFPSAVSRSRLQSAQKCADTGLISPTRPAAPGSRYSRATPPSGGSASSAGSASVTAAAGRYASGPKPLSSIGISSIKRTSTPHVRVSAASAGISSSLNPPMSTAFIFTRAKPASSAASMPRSASESAPPRVM